LEVRRWKEEWREDKGERREERRKEEGERRMKEGGRKEEGRKGGRRKREGARYTSDQDDVGIEVGGIRGTLLVLQAPHMNVVGDESLAHPFLLGLFFFYSPFSRVCSPLLLSSFLPSSHPPFLFRPFLPSPLARPLLYLPPPLRPPSLFSLPPFPSLSPTLFPPPYLSIIAGCSIFSISKNGIGDDTNWGRQITPNEVTNWRREEEGREGRREGEGKGRREGEGREGEGEGREGRREGERKITPN
jgi:hypothetical protein